MYRWTTLLIVTMACMPVGFTVADLKSARKSLAKEMAAWQVQPKFDVGTYARFTVTPDGFPTRDKQGVYRGMGASRKHKQAVCARQGNYYALCPVGIRTRKQEIQIGMFSCSVLFIIQFPRPLQAGDFSAAAIQQAMSSVFHFSNGVQADNASAIALERALSPIEVRDTTTLFESVQLIQPAGWRAKIDQDRVFYNHANHEIRISSRALKPTELSSGPALMLQEEIPRKLLTSAKRQDPGAELLNIARMAELAPGLWAGSAGVLYNRTFERHDWLYAESEAKLYTIRGKTRSQNASQLQPFMTQLTQSASWITPDMLTDQTAEELPQLVDLFGQSATPLTFNGIQQSAQSVWPGQEITFTVDFSINATNSIRGARVVQQGYVYLDGALILSQPTTTTHTLSQGNHQAVHAQPVPGNAYPGQYRYVAQLCIADDCQTRQTYFTVN